MGTTPHLAARFATRVDWGLAAVVVAGIAYGWNAAGSPAAQASKDPPITTVVFESPDGRSSREPGAEAVEIQPEKEKAAAETVRYAATPASAPETGGRCPPDPAVDAVGENAQARQASVEALSSLLPREKRETFEDLVATGEVLIRDGLKAPAYGSSDLDDRYVAELVQLGLAQVALKLPGEKKLFFFRGTFQRPESAYRNHDLAVFERFSERAIVLEPDRAERFLHVFWRDFLRHESDGRPRCVLLLQRAIDLAILAAQADAATRCGMALEHLSFTYGRFEKAGAFPFRFVVERMVDTEGNEIPIRRVSKDVRR